MKIRLYRAIQKYGSIEALVREFTILSLKGKGIDEDLARFMLKMTTQMGVREKLERQSWEAPGTCETIKLNARGEVVVVVDQ